MARRRGRPVWPLVAPFVVLFEMLVFYGEPRYHAMADLGLIVLAAFAIDRIVARRSEASPPAAPRRPSAPADRARTQRARRLPSVHVPR